MLEMPTRLRNLSRSWAVSSYIQLAFSVFYLFVQSFNFFIYIYIIIFVLYFYTYIKYIMILKNNYYTRYIEYYSYSIFYSFLLYLSKIFNLSPMTPSPIWSKSCFSYEFQFLAHVIFYWHQLYFRNSQTITINYK